MIKQIKLYVLFLWHSLLTVIGFSRIDGQMLRSIYRYHFELTSFFGRESERTNTLDLIRIAACRQRPRNIREFAMCQKLLKTNNLRKELYILLLQAGDIRPRDISLAIGLSKQKKEFVRWLAGRNEDLVFA